MRRSAWTMGVALLAALSLGVAACGGDDNEGSEWRAPPRPARAMRIRRRQAGRQAHRALGGRRRLLRLRPGVLPGGLHRSATPPSARCTRTSPTTASTWCRTSPRRCPRSPRTARPSRSRSSTGVKFSPPVDREVTSKDVKYAMERMFFSTVATGYSFYFEDIVGAKAGAKPGTKIEGIETPGRPDARHQAVQGDAAACWPSGALGHAGHGAGPRGVRGASSTRRSPTTYGENQVATGPVHDRERRLRQGDRLRARRSASTWSATRTGTRRRTTSPPTSTRSTTSRAMTTRTSPRGAS